MNSTRPKQPRNPDSICLPGVRLRPDGSSETVENLQAFVDGRATESADEVHEEIVHELGTAIGRALLDGGAARDLAKVAAEDAEYAESKRGPVCPTCSRRVNEIQPGEENCDDAAHGRGPDPFGLGPNWAPQSEESKRLTRLARRAQTEGLSIAEVERLEKLEAEAKAIGGNP